MLGLTKKVGYALIGLTHMARQPADELSSSREIANEYNVPAALLMNILKELSNAGLVESVRGARGGYRLARPPEQISVADVLRVLEGGVHLAECVREEGPDGTTSCTLMETCPIRDPIHRLHRKMHDFLRGCTLAEIARPPQSAQTA
jgi:Rrf2 family protein